MQAGIQAGINNEAAIFREDRGMAALCVDVFYMVKVMTHIVHNYYLKL
jgi:hypothetical protein